MRNLRNTDCLAVAVTTNHDQIGSLRVEMREGFEGFKAQLIGLAADQSESSPTFHSNVAGDISSLVAASNQHTANGVRMATVVDDALMRTRKLEGSLDALTAVHATLNSHDATLKAILDRISALSGSAPPAPSPANAALLAVGSKRPRDYDTFEEPTKRLHVAPGLMAPPAFALPVAPPAPAFAAPGFGPPAPALAPAGFTLPLPTAPSALPRAPPSSNPPRVHVPPTREVLFGPMNWENNHKNTPRQLILNVLANVNMRSARFSARKGDDDQTAVLTFDADAVAQWFIATWNASSRVGFEICIAHSAAAPLNT
ncbi:hypothetical protein C8R46DRAFT_1094389 [Mycena filopes]|nr:hypothetical protein C8R46DRAFT_1094389 [Mycena filopes]